MPGRHDRVPPYSEGAESSFLGAVMLDSIKIMNMAVEYGTQPEWFYVPSHRIVWEVMANMHQVRQVIDIITVTDRLRTTSKLDSVGGSIFIDKLMDSCPTKEHALYHLQIIKEKYNKRAMISHFREMEQLAYEEILAGEITGRSQVFMNSLDVREVRRKTPIETVRNAAKMLRTAQGTGFIGIPSRWLAFQRKLSGYRVRNMNIIAGRPGQGKTTWMCNESLFEGKEGYKVGIISLEMSEEELRTKHIIDELKINWADWINGHCTDQDIDRFQRCGERLCELPIKITDTSKSISQVLAWIWDNSDDLDIIWLDYIQAIRQTSSDSKNERERISAWSNAITSTAKETGLPVNVLCQFTRGPEYTDHKGKSRRPRLSDLHGSGSLEQDANQVIFLYQDLELDGERFSGNTRTMAEIAKNRNAAIGELMMTFAKTIGRFTTGEEQADLAWIN
ncbi:MAG: hypothetical protein IH951_11655 [Bacteroidetes bacterium]|nr:hypothetical protein [Bacteroidota bacterium]